MMERQKQDLLGQGEEKDHNNPRCQTGQRGFRMRTILRYHDAILMQI